MHILAGLLTGVAASMGLGGGFILIIYLTAFTEIGQLEAGGINLLFFLPIALVSIIIHAKNKLIDWKVVPKICIIGVFGVVIGALLMRVIDEAIIQKLFAVLLIFVGVRELFHKNTEKSPEKEQSPKPNEG